MSSELWSRLVYGWTERGLGTDRGLQYIGATPDLLVSARTGRTQFDPLVHFLGHVPAAALGTRDEWFAGALENVDGRWCVVRKSIPSDLESRHIVDILVAPHGVEVDPAAAVALLERFPWFDRVADIPEELEPVDPWPFSTVQPAVADNDLLQLTVALVAFVLERRDGFRGPGCWVDATPSVVEAAVGRAFASVPTAMLGAVTFSTFEPENRASLDIIGCPEGRLAASDRRRIAIETPAESDSRYLEDAFRLVEATASMEFTALRDYRGLPARSMADLELLDRLQYAEPTPEGFVDLLRHPQMIEHGSAWLAAPGGLAALLEAAAVHGGTFTADERQRLIAALSAPHRAMTPERMGDILQIVGPWLGMVRDPQMARRLIDIVDIAIPDRWRAVNWLAQYLQAGPRMDLEMRMEVLRAYFSEALPNSEEASAWWYLVVAFNDLPLLVSHIRDAGFVNARSLVAAAIQTSLSHAVPETLRISALRDAEPDWVDEAIVGLPAGAIVDLIVAAGRIEDVSEPLERWLEGMDDETALAVLSDRELSTVPEVRAWIEDHRDQAAALAYGQYWFGDLIHRRGKFFPWSR